MTNSCTTRKITSIAVEYNGNDKGQAVNVATNNLLGFTAEEQYMEMKEVAKRNSRIGNGKWACTGYISPPKIIADKISDEELRDLCLQTLKRIGVTPDNQYRLDIHNSANIKHIHFIVNRVDTFGKCTLSSGNIGKRFGEELRKICSDKGLMTDLESSKKKKEEMLVALTKSISESRNFSELERGLLQKGYLLKLFQNAKDGISGLRITKQSDISTKTNKVYQTGFKLSEISNQIRVAEIKEIFHIKNLVENQLDKISSIYDLKKFADQNEIKIFLKRNSEKNIMEIFLKPEENLPKNGFFYHKNSGYNLSEIDSALHEKLIKNINFQNENESQTEINLEIDILTDLVKIIEIITKPSYSSSEDEFRRKRKNYKTFRR